MICELQACCGAWWAAGPDAVRRAALAAPATGSPPFGKLLLVNVPAGEVLDPALVPLWEDSYFRFGGRVIRSSTLPSADIWEGDLVYQRYRKTVERYLVAREFQEPTYREVQLYGQYEPIAFRNLPHQLELADKNHLPILATLYPSWDWQAERLRSAGFEKKFNWINDGTNNELDFYIKYPQAPVVLA